MLLFFFKSKIIFICNLLLLHIIININDAAPVWTKAKTELPTPLSTFAAGVYEDKMYLVGGVIDKFGETPNRMVWSIDLLDPNDNTNLIDIVSSDYTNLWLNSTVFPAGGTCCFDTQRKRAMTVYTQGSSYSSNKLYIVPFTTEHSTKQTPLIIYDMHRNTYRSPQEYKYQLPYSLCDPCVTSNDYYVFIIGGAYFIPPSDITWKDTFQIYDIENNEWIDGAPLNIPRRASACAILNDILYIFGGRSYDDPYGGWLNSIEKIDLITDNSEWEILSATTLMKSDEELRAVVDNDNELIYIVGGRFNMSEIQVFDSTDFVVKKFSFVDVDQKHLDEVESFTPIIYGNSMYLLGGETKDSFIPINTIHSANLSDLNNYYRNVLRSSTPLQAIGRYSTAKTSDGKKDTISIDVDINTVTNDVYIVMDGPALKYFSIGFNAKAHTDAPYIIIIYGSQSNVLIEERKLGARGAGDILTNMLTIDKVEHYTDPDTGELYREVTMHRKRIGITNDHYTFPLSETQINIIYAHGTPGSDSSVSYHWTQKGSSKLFFMNIPCTFDGLKCFNENVDYCCNSNAQCSNVLIPHPDKISDTINEIRCCINDYDSTCVDDSGCCGELMCNSTTHKCIDPICIYPGDECISGKVNFCCDDKTSCSTQYDDNFNDNVVCCIDNINNDLCEDNGCCGFAECDKDSRKCCYPQGVQGCIKNNDCCGSLNCISNFCTKVPTNQPTPNPSRKPTDSPTIKPTRAPFPKPTERPTLSPTKRPTEYPTEDPTDEPTEKMTDKPTHSPTYKPIQTMKPTGYPTKYPTEYPTNQPTEYPTIEPKPMTHNPTQYPTNRLTTEYPSKMPTKKPITVCITTSDDCFLGGDPDQCCNSKAVCSGKYSGPNDIFSEICCINDFVSDCIYDGCCLFGICHDGTKTCCIPHNKGFCDEDKHCCDDLRCNKDRRVCEIIVATPPPTSEPTEKVIKTPKPTEYQTKYPTKYPTDTKTPGPTPYKTRSPTAHKPTDKPTVLAPSDKDSPSPTYKPIEPTPRPTKKPSKYIPSEDSNVIKPLPHESWWYSAPEFSYDSRSSSSSYSSSSASSSSSSSSNSHDISYPFDDAWGRRRRRRQRR